MRINEKHGGARPNAGRKPKAREEELSALLSRVWKPEDRENVIKALHAKAADGNEKAASLLLSYAYGKPTERVEHSNPDGSNLLTPIAEALTKIYGATTTPATD